MACCAAGLSRLPPTARLAASPWLMLVKPRRETEDRRESDHACHRDRERAGVAWDAAGRLPALTREHPSAIYWILEMSSASLGANMASQWQRARRDALVDALLARIALPLVFATILMLAVVPPALSAAVVGVGYLLLFTTAAMSSNKKIFKTPFSGAM